MVALDGEYSIFPNENLNIVHIYKEDFLASILFYSIQTHLYWAD